jgi:virginiamycin B lyase
MLLPGAGGPETTARTITEFPLPNPASGPSGITAGPDMNLWFAENNAKTIGAIKPHTCCRRYVTRIRVAGVASK